MSDNDAVNLAFYAWVDALPFTIEVQDVSQREVWRAAWEASRAALLAEQQAAHDAAMRRGGEG